MNIKSILLAVDLTEDPGAISEKVFSRLQCGGAQLYIIHVIQDISRVSLYSDAYTLWEQYRDRACKDTIIKLEEYIKAFAGRFSDIQPLVEVGDPAAVVVAQAEKFNVDLIVTGNHCRQGIDHLLHRNVSEKVTRLAARDVFSFYIC